MCCGYEFRFCLVFKDWFLENFGCKNREDKIYKKFRVVDSVIFEFEWLEKIEKKIIFCVVIKKKFILICLYYNLIVLCC